MAAVPAPRELSNKQYVAGLRGLDEDEPQTLEEARAALTAKDTELQQLRAQLARLEGVPPATTMEQ